MGTMKVSVVATVLNEEKSVRKLLLSLINQTTKPTEIVIVDGGSSDRTVANIKYKQNLAFQAQISNIKYKPSVRIFVKPKYSIAQGRNFGIKNAQNDIIAVTDGGCIPHLDWLEKITEPFNDHKVEVVAGFYRMVAKTSLQRAYSVFVGISPPRFKASSFMPSARSIAFRKKIWQVIGGYPELFKTGEDTLFNFKLLQYGVKFKVVEKAQVDWIIDVIDVPAVLRNFFSYAKGDAETGIWWHPAQKFSTHNLKIMLVFLRYGIGVILLLLSFKFTSLFVLLVLFFIIFLFWAIVKFNSEIKDWSVRRWLPIIQILSDLGVMSGFLIGIFAIKWLKHFIQAAVRLKTSLKGEFSKAFMIIKND